MLVEWAMAGLGIADVPTFLLADHIDSGALEPVLLDYSTEDYGMFVVRPPGSYVPGKVRVLIDSHIDHSVAEANVDLKPRVSFRTLGPSNAVISIDMENAPDNQPVDTSHSQAIGIARIAGR